jgi:pimeloyl-ACP methyl ester carboxylesterase
MQPVAQDRIKQGSFRFAVPKMGVLAEPMLPEKHHEIDQVNFFTMPDTQPQTESLDIGDATVQYLIYANNGPTIMLLHATGFSPWLWHPIAARLADHFRVIAPYFCDHRETDPEKGGLSWMQLADDLCQLCDGLDIQKPLLVGHSMGATVMTLAEATHGPKASGLVLIEPIFLPQEFYGIPIGVEDHPLARLSIRRRNAWADVETAKAYLRTKALFSLWDDTILDLYIKHGMVSSQEGGLELACAPPREAALFMGGMPYDPWPLIPKIQCPVLTIEGGKSQNRRFMELTKAANLFPEGSYRLIAEAGHLIPMEKPHAIYQIIKKQAGQRLSR